MNVMSGVILRVWTHSFKVPSSEELDHDYLWRYGARFPERAPWYVIPANRKWFARFGAAAVLVHTLMEIDPRYPAVSKPQRQALLEVKEALEAQAPKGAAPDPFEQEQPDANGREAARRDGHPTPPPAATSSPDDEPTAERRG